MATAHLNYVVKTDTVHGAVGDSLQTFEVKSEANSRTG